MKPYRTTLFLSGKVLSAALLALVLLPGCGKKDMPVPNDPARNFSWEQVDASKSGNCLALSGKFTGAYENLDSLRLELAPVSGPEDCPGCPFVPKEILYFSRSEAGFNQDTGAIGFSYCPKPAAAYRWRLTGISIFNRLPHTVSHVGITGKAF